MWPFRGTATTAPSTIRRGSLHLWLALAAAALAAAAVVAHAATGSRQATPLAAPSRLSAPAAAPATQSEQTVARLQAQLRAAPDDPGALGQLGLAYEQRARETADPA